MSTHVPHDSSPAELPPPGTDAYGALDPFQKHDAAAAALEKHEASRAEAERDEAWGRLNDDLRAEWLHWALECDYQDPIWAIRHHFHVHDGEQDRLVDEVITDEQLGVLKIIVKAWRENRSITLKILKRRDIKMTTVIAWWFYWFATRRPGKMITVLAHDDDTARDIFLNKYRYTHDHDPFRDDDTQSDTRSELVFSNRSSIKIATVGAGIGVKAGTRAHGIHGSECFRWDAAGFSPAGYSSVKATLFKPPIWTCIVEEGTGMGPDEPFAVEWEALDKPNALSDAERLFFPWWSGGDARAGIPFYSHEERERFRAALDDDDKALQHAPHGPDGTGCTLEQLHWLYWYANNRVSWRTLSEKRLNRRRDMPSTPTDAFLASGKTAFDVYKLAVIRAHPKCRDATLRGELKPTGQMRDDRMGFPLEATPKAEFIESLNGPLHLLGRPQAGHRYHVGVDISEGRPTGDAQAALVFDEDVPTVVGAAWGHFSKNVLFDQTRLLSCWFGDAFINPETNAFGSFTEDLARTDRSLFLYLRRGPRDTIGTEFQDRHGTRTTAPVKADGVRIIEQIIDDDYERVKLGRDPRVLIWRPLVDQLIRFEAEESGKRMRYGGDEDDLVMAFMHALFCARDMQRPEPERRVVLTDAEGQAGERQRLSMKEIRRLDDAAQADAEQPEDRNLSPYMRAVHGLDARR